jgi:lipoyl-dependent peroxiredoxin subunit D
VTQALESIRDALPEAAKDLRLNLAAVLEDSRLSPAQRWGVAVASAYAARNPRLTQAIIEGAREQQIEENTIEDARAAAALMAMNNVYYRFRHQIANDDYARLPARLRMNRLAQTKGPKTEFELFSLAVSAINGCEACVRSHEKVARQGGLDIDAIHDAVRIAAVVHGVAVALETAS